MSLDTEKRTTRLRVTLAAFGTEGDVRPFIWLADKLAEKGHAVSFVASPIHAALIADAGYPCRGAGEEASMRRVLGDPRLWDGLKGSSLVLQAMLENLGPMAEPLLDPNVTADLIAGSSLAVSAAVAAEARQIPYIRVHLQPAIFRSATAMPLLAPSLAWLRRMPAVGIRFFFRLLDLSLNKKPLSAINALRRQLDLREWRSFYRDGFCGDGPTAALFPSWFGEPQADWPVDVRCFDFPLRRSRARSPLPASLQGFLASGDAPILWTHGSGNLHTEAFGQAAEDCCRRIGRRGILVAPVSAPGPGASDKSFLRIAHAPFDRLLPACCAIVHHGGIGTIAESLHAGLPQLINPCAHDQFDNADRAQRLGFALALPRGNLGRAADALKTILAESRYADRSRELGQRIGAADEIVPWLEACATRATPQPSPPAFTS